MPCVTPLNRMHFVVSRHVKGGDRENQLDLEFLLRRKKIEREEEEWRRGKKERNSSEIKTSGS